MALTIPPGTARPAATINSTPRKRSDRNDARNGTRFRSFDERRRCRRNRSGAIGRTEFVRDPRRPSHLPQELEDYKMLLTTSPISTNKRFSLADLPIVSPNRSSRTAHFQRRVHLLFIARERSYFRCI